MTFPRYIGIAGPARSGKDTAAGWLIEQGFRQYSFAAPLKAGLKVMLGLDARHTDGDLKELPLESYGASPRRMMQTLGTEWGRELINDRVWLIRAGEITEEWLRSPDVRGVVISDVRFENEAAWLREKGGLLVHLRRAAAHSVEAHASEAGVAVEAGDPVVHNDGTIDELFVQLAGIMGLDHDERDDDGRLSGADSAGIHRTGRSVTRASER